MYPTKLDYLGNTTVGLSPGVWHGCPIVDFMTQRTGVFFMDDFTNFGDDAAGTGTNVAGYQTHSDTGNTIKMLSTEVGGVLRFALDATDNDSASISTGRGKAGLVSFVSGQRMWFEARVRLGQITDQCIAIGLAEEGLAADNGIFADNATELADKDFVGFRVASGNPDEIDVCYNTAGGGGVTVHKNQAQVAVADTWYKLGLYFDGRIVRFFINNAQVGDGLLITATNFPDGEKLALLSFLKNGTADARTFDVDWWAVAQALE